MACLYAILSSVLIDNPKLHYEYYIMYTSIIVYHVLVSFNGPVTFIRSIVGPMTPLNTGPMTPLK